jgi:hypothetical protein
MVRHPIEAMEQRDQGFQKLSDLTRIVFFWCAGLLALFSVIAAVTIPGQSQNTSNTPANPGDTSFAPATTDDGQPLQGPATGSFQPGGGRPIAVSGGSHSH